MKSSLSLVIPAYNEEFYIRDCLSAIDRQTLRPHEVIVVDNNSVDATVSIAREFKFVKVLSESKQGVLYARNHGFNSATGSIIGRIDADTVLPINWVETVEKLFESPAVNAVTGPVSYYDMPLPKTNYRFDHNIRLILTKISPNAPFLFGSNSALRKTVWDEIKTGVCIGDNFHEDLDLAIHLRSSGFKITYTRQILASTSARRYDDHLPAFHSYMKMYHYSYSRHQIKNIGPHLATSFYWLGYLALRPFRLAYDEKTKKRSFKRLLSAHQPRKHPMSGKLL